MDTSTTIRKMMADGTIEVPSFQRAYSWDTPIKNQERVTHTDVFLDDLEKHCMSGVRSPYYFGHFLFEEHGSIFRVIDGQQRLTTIVIFLSALFTKLKQARALSESEEMCYEDMVRRRSVFHFSTVDYDNQLFIDYVIEQTKNNKNGLKTVSAQRIVRAFDFFVEQLSAKPEDYLTRMLSVVSNAVCTTHLVRDESEAIQMFIFHNNRGKKPSHLEIIKAQFMYIVHLHGNEDKNTLAREIKNRFETIYRSISSIENCIDEDDVLLYTLRVHFNSLWEGNALGRISKRLSEAEPLTFVKDFTHSLSETFEYLTEFFIRDEQAYFAIHSLIRLGGLAIALPFIIKAYKFGLEIDDIAKLSAAFESLVLRHRLIGTRADMATRINDVFKTFTKQNRAISPITERIQWLKTQTEWWAAHWNNISLESSLQGYIEPSVAKYLLWKYENSLEREGKDGYEPTRYNRIKEPELEHIAPETEPKERPHGYCEYDEEFRQQYLECLGNYLLLSKSHNCAEGNAPFSEKRKTYIHTEQQREIRELVPDTGVWSKKIIAFRKDKIIKFIMANF